MILRANSKPFGFAASGIPRWRWRRPRLPLAGPGRLPPDAAPCRGSTREFFFATQSGQGHEQVGQCHQAHMMVPARPSPRFVLRHSKVTFTVLEVFLDAVARAGYQCHRLQRLVGSRVGDVVFHFAIGLQRASQQQPAWRASSAMTNSPYPHACERKCQWPLGTRAQLQHLPSRWRQILSDVPHGAHVIGTFSVSAQKKIDHPATANVLTS
jgi:hypothetical protein